MKRKTILSLISLLMISFTLLSSVSCGLLYPDKPTDTDEIINITDENDADNAFSGLEIKDFGEKEFRIATDDVELIKPINSSNIFSKKIYERISQIENKFNVKIVTTQDSGLVSINEKIKIEANAGTDYCDLAIINVVALQNLVSQDLVQNINSLPYINTESKHYYSDAVNSMTLNNKTYGLCGDLTYKPDNLYVVYFNQDIINSIGYPSLYDLVLSNQWDIENFREYSKVAYSIKRDGGWKTFGYSSGLEQENLIDIFWAASGQRFVDNKKGSDPTLIFYNENTIKIMDEISETLFHSVYAYGRSKSALDNFKVGNCLFYIGTLGEIEEITTSSQKWGVVPIPKIDINQDNYYSYMGLDYEVACFPNKSYNPEMSGLITEALFSVFDGTTKTDFLSNYLNLYLPNLQSGYMIQQAIESPDYDPALFFGGVYNEYASATNTIITRALTTNTSFDKLYTQYEKQFYKFLQNID